MGLMMAWLMGRN